MPNVKSSKRALRSHKIVVSLNDHEAGALVRFCEQYGIRNRSKMIRETVMRAILKRLDEDSPTLFD